MSSFFAGVSSSEPVFSGLALPAVESKPGSEFPGARGTSTIFTGAFDASDADFGGFFSSMLKRSKSTEDIIPSDNVHPLDHFMMEPLNASKIKTFMDVVSVEFPHISPDDVIRLAHACDEGIVSSHFCKTSDPMARVRGFFLACEGAGQPSVSVQTRKDGKRDIDILTYVMHESFAANITMGNFRARIQRRLQLGEAVRRNLEKQSDLQSFPHQIVTMQKGDSKVFDFAQTSGDSRIRLEVTVLEPVKFVLKYVPDAWATGGLTVEGLRAYLRLNQLPDVSDEFIDACMRTPRRYHTLDAQSSRRTGYYRVNGFAIKVERQGYFKFSLTLYTDDINQPSYQKDKSGDFERIVQKIRSKTLTFDPFSSDLVHVAAIKTSKPFTEALKDDRAYLYVLTSNHDADETNLAAVEYDGTDASKHASVAAFARFDEQTPIVCAGFLIRMQPGVLYIDDFSGSFTPTEVDLRAAKTFFEKLTRGAVVDVHVSGDDVFSDLSQRSRFIRSRHPDSKKRR